MSKIKLGKYTVEITHPDKIWFPRDSIKKIDVVEYYQGIASTMLPYLKGRPITMLRFPDGIDGQEFYQKDTPDYFPSWIKRVLVKKEGGTLHHVMCENAATLIYLINQACITPHIWLSKADKVMYPDRMIFDLDPSGTDFTLVRQTALVIKELLEDFGLHPFVMTTGSRGIHVVVPLKRDVKFPDVRSFARDVATMLVKDNPKQLTIEVRKSKRGKKLFIDTLRNSYAATGVSPYAVRARDGAPVATPLQWDEVNDKKLTAQRYTIKNIFKRLAVIDDPWHAINDHAVSLKRVLARQNKK